MKTTENFNIVLSKEIYESDFHHELLKEELQKMLSNKQLKSNHVNMYCSYVYENDEYISMGIYLINNSDKDILINKLPLSICNKKEKIFDYTIDINKTIFTNNAIFKEISILKSDLALSYNIDDIYIEFDDLKKINKYPYINIEIDNMPKVNGYKSYREGKKFLKNLSNIEENQFSIDIFKVGQVEEGFCIIALFRNSSSKAINIKSIPLTVLVSENLPVYKGVYNINDDGLIIESNKGKFYSIIIPLESFIQIDYEDMSKYIVKFQ
ncbi:SLAP domain-containing protein [Clostridium algidicarnis]|uniref:SLAP domain-containing protein n=1 Tax=Clostridium algidicarnis TaxID=37659 RepID=UPI001CF34591|nr:SLAP domain-containing protein [Clostridium algidicarnis]MCB2286358.1 SLAP domain-containing protein [Clostridium algidicarnis]